MAMFNQSEMQLLIVLYRSGKPLPTKAIAEKAGMSWATAKKYLSMLYEKNVLDRARYKNAVYWWIKVE